LGEDLSKNLFSWLSPKRGHEVADLAKEHFELAKAVIENLKSMIEEDAKGNQEESDKYFWILHEKEHEADIVRTELIEKVSISEMFPEEKMDMIDLARAIDFIADGGHEAGRLLSILDLSKVPAELMDIITDMANTDYACVEALQGCYQTMRSSPKKCVDATAEVESLEEKGDMLYAKSRVLFGKLKFTGWEPGAVYMLIEFVGSLEFVADWCENTSDIIKAIAVKIQ
jgi:predicted phosphate transport protein (TIGR00153 family)